MKVFLSSAYVLSALVLAVDSPAQSSAPSFDCSKASSAAEKLVCTDEALAALDRKMAGVYDMALTRWPADDLATLKAYQRGWVKGRDECWKADDARDCVEYAYRSRIVELQIQSGQLMAPTPVGYTCKGNEGTPVLAAFYDQTEPPSAVLTVGDDQVITFRSSSGSATKYTADNVELSEPQGDATLEWFGTRYECQASGG